MVSTFTIQSLVSAGLAQVFFLHLFTKACTLWHTFSGRLKEITRVSAPVLDLLGSELRRQ